MNNHNHFQRGSGVFTCSLCSRRTRGNEESASLELCGECYELCGWDNQHNDDGTKPNAEELTYLNTKVATIEKRGGDVTKVREHCSYIWR